MNKFTEKEIRAVRGAQAEFNIYWVYTEVLVNGNWAKAYIVNEERLEWHRPETKMYPNEKNMREYISKELETINRLLEEGWKIVNCEKYEEIIHKYYHPLEYKLPKTVYL